MSLITHNTSEQDADMRWKAAMAENRRPDPTEFAAFMLTKTSRTFALNIQVLPQGLHNQVQLAYLFCRMADTLEDDPNLDVLKKIQLIHAFRGLIPPGPDFESRWTHFYSALPENWARSDKWDQLLVAHGHWLFPLLTGFSTLAVKAITECVEEMCDGMIRFTAKQERTTSNQAEPVLIETMEDLDGYCYYVAGTVGQMLCKLFALHSNLIDTKRAQALNSLSVSFGLGLQLTNILKDIHEDALRNVSYIPLSLMAQEGLSSVNFLSKEGRQAKARIMVHLIQKAKKHLEDALEYTCLLPRLEPRLRLFCLWPLFMAAETIVLIAHDLDATSDRSNTKISRSQVKRIVRKTSLVCWSNGLTRKMLRTTLESLDSTLQKYSNQLPTNAGFKPRFASGILGL